MSASIRATPDAVHALLRSELVELGVDEESITPDTKFDQLDIDSLDVADMMVNVKRAYGVNIPRADLADVTIGQLVDRIVETQAG